jgi:hypothetical protein
MFPHVAISLALTLVASGDTVIRDVGLSRIMPSASASGSLRAAIDANARVALTTTTLGASFVWQKDGITFATTGTGSVTDQRSNKNYTHIPAQSCTETVGVFSNVNHAEYRSTGNNARKTTTINGTWTCSFTGVEFVLLLDRQLRATPGTYAEAQIDGGAWEEIQIDTSASEATQSNYAWGKSGLANAAHTVAVRLKANPTAALGVIFDGLFSSDRSTSLGTAVVYAVTIDGTITEQITVTPGVNRLGVLQKWADRAVALSASWPPLDGALYEFNEYLGGAALLYILTGDERLRGVADKIYDAYVAARDANGLVPYAAEGKRIVLNGRTPYDYWLAWKAFGDTKYLTAAELVVTTLRDTWPRQSPTSPTTSIIFPGVWAETFENAAPVHIGNQWSAAAYSCALLYNEPASTHYQNATLLTRIQQNAAWAMDASYDPVGMRWVYSRSFNTFLPARVYGDFQHEHQEYLATVFDYFHDEIDLAAANISGFGIAEPHWYSDAHYDTAPTSGAALMPIVAYRRNGLAYTSGFVDRVYSAAFASMHMKYDPRGADNAAWDARSVLWDSIRPAQALYVAGIDSSDWAVATTVGVPRAPVGRFVTEGNASVILHPGWSATATSFNVYETSDGSTPSKTNGTQIVGVTDGQVLSSRTNGTAYKYVFTAVNAAGESAESTVQTVTPTTNRLVNWGFESALGSEWSTVVGSVARVGVDANTFPFEGRRQLRETTAGAGATASAVQLLSSFSWASFLGNFRASLASRTDVSVGDTNTKIFVAFLMLDAADVLIGRVDWILAGNYAGNGAASGNDQFGQRVALSAGVYSTVSFNVKSTLEAELTSHGKTTADVDHVRIYLRIDTQTTACTAYLDNTLLN